MKKFSYLLMLIVLLVGCKKNTTEPKLEGRWNVMRVTDRKYDQNNIMIGENVYTYPSSSLCDYIIIENNSITYYYNGSIQNVYKYVHNGSDLREPIYQDQVRTITELTGSTLNIHSANVVLPSTSERVETDEFFTR